jgi:predicted unusual protein kinase regulating ubiquinone biosynthesis (AarF/ABC1/UbiB family)
MSGSLLGPDQIRKVNATFPALVEHIKSLLSADHSGLGLMKVHCMVESFDSDEMARIFRELSFISPLEKKALVRAAIYELLAKEPALFVSPELIVVKSTIAETVLVKDEPKLFTPPQFKLNVTTSNAAETAKTDTKPTPVVTSTHTPIVAEKLKAGEEEQKIQNEKVAAAVAKLREATGPKPIEIAVVPEDAVLTTEAPVEE